jgi:hypothetical protein
VRALADEGRTRRTITASGEVGAVVHDGLAGPVTARNTSDVSRGRARLVALTSTAVLTAAGLFAFGAVQPERVPVARAEISHLVAAQRLAMMKAAASSQESAPAAALPAAAASAAPAQTEVAPAPAPSADGVAPATTGNPAHRGVRRYRKFDH